VQKFHDVLVVQEDNRLFQFVVDDDGGFTRPPNELSVDHPGYRKVMGIVDPSDDRGAAFAVLPIRPDPATASVCCYVINAANVDADNVWTEADWDAEPSASDGSLEPEAAPAPPSLGFEVLIAGPGGRLYCARVDDEGEPKSFEVVPPAQLGNEAEIWAQLRNGVVAGTVRRRGGQPEGAPVPLVNLTSLIKEEVLS
jgi:hypothetical protein